MVVSFNTFQFNTLTGILTHQGQVIDLQPKQQALLALFISNPEIVLSKERILDSVWQNRVVSEQVVFQTISQLRTILGERAIQTYPRKGYKWLYPITHNNEQAPSASLASKRPKSIGYAISAVLIFTLITGYGIWRNASFQALQIFYLSHDDSQPLLSQLSDGVMDFKPLSHNRVASLKFMNMPELAYKELAVGNHAWLMGTRLFQTPEGQYLEFKLQSNDIQWHDYVFAKDPSTLASKLQKQLHQLSQVGLFDSANQVNHWVNILERADDYNAQSKTLFLANYYYRLGHVDAALAHLESIAKQPISIQNMPIRIEAALLKTSIYKHNGQYTLAKSTLDKAENELAQKIWPLQFELIKKQAFLAYAMRNLQQVEVQLKRGTQLAQQNIDAEGRFQLHILDSILSAKLGLNERKYLQLNEAQQLANEENLHPSHLAFVYFHYALFSTDEGMQEKYLKKVLPLPRSQANFWVIDDAFERLFDLYVQTGKFKQANTLLTSNVAHAVNRNLLQARLLLAQDQTQQAILFLEDAYQQAQKAFDKNASIHAARALYLHLQEQNQKRQLYYDFLQRSGEHQWLKNHLNNG